MTQKFEKIIENARNLKALRGKSLERLAQIGLERKWVGNPHVGRPESRIWNRIWSETGRLDGAEGSRGLIFSIGRVSIL